jgi:hypothetical protein
VSVTDPDLSMVVREDCELTILPTRAETRVYESPLSVYTVHVDLVEPSLPPASPASPAPPPPAPLLSDGVVARVGQAVGVIFALTLCANVGVCCLHCAVARRKKCACTKRRLPPLLLVAGAVARRRFRALESDESREHESVEEK